ncbi:MAG: protein arginine kinase [Planctomycetota bacterium]|nr:protein arginine kinase [Planctomycetota bacterium]
MQISDLSSQAGEWLSGSGPETDVVISSRIRLARNIAGFPFISKASESQRAQVQLLLRKEISRARLEKGLFYLDLQDTDSLDRLLLVERHLISHELARGSGDRGVALGRQEILSIMVNEEDHLRLQVLQSGFQLDQAWSVINKVDDMLGKRVEYAFHGDLGYLTACPTNVGTGLRVSVMLHLPALVITKQIEKVFRAVSKINLAVRGLYGEGTQASGDFYQISNQVTLGQSEEDIIYAMKEVVPQVIKFEREVRQSLFTQSLKGLEDRIWRAYGQLKCARVISSEETMNLLSSLRMGVNLGIVTDVPVTTINEIFLLTQPAHLQKLEGRKLDGGERDVARATFIRNRIN